MPNQFFVEQGPFNITEDVETIFATDYWLFEQYIGDQLFSWGRNADGQIGDNTIASRSTPVQEFTSSTNWKQSTGGYRHNAAIKIDGTLWSWGRNADGQIGDNTIASRSTPVQEFTSSTNWKQVSAGDFHTAAIKIDGTLWLWGRNVDGQIGDNTNGSRSTPVQEFTSSTNWKQVSCGRLSTTAIKTDGTLWLWGRNSYGQIGVNDRVTRSTPVQEFTSSTNWKQSTGGYRHNAAIKIDGTLWVWGRNLDGELGVNDRVTRSTPVQEFTSSTNWKQVSAGAGYNTAAIKTNGTLWLWGRNADGQIGVNDRVTRSTPVQEFTSSTNWKQSAGGYRHNAAIKTDGTLWLWGRNSFGQLGINDLVSRSTPVQEFTSSTNWKQVSAGGYHVGSVKTGINIDTGYSS